MSFGVELLSERTELRGSSPFDKRRCEGYVTGHTELLNYIKPVKSNFTIVYGNVFLD